MSLMNRLTVSCLSLGLLLGGCQRGGTEATGTTGDALVTPYASLESSIDSKVTTTGWLLGEGESYKVGGSYLLVLTPNASLDWVAFFADHDEMDEISKSLEGDPDGRASAADVEAYTRLQNGVNAWSAQVAAIEREGATKAWAHFRENAMTAEYDAVGETPLVLIIPKRSELKAVADKVMARYRQIAKTCEVEIVGTVHSSEDWADKENVAASLAVTAKTRPVVVKVESFRVLRLARDLTTGPTAASATNLEDTRTNDSGR